jgi:predicted TPR repeat methyltransferase
MPSTEISKLMQKAVQCQRDGRAGEAAAIYKNIVQIDSCHADALWQLGKMAHQQGNLAEAAEMLQRWITLNPNEAEAHGILGDIFRAQGKFDLAICQYNEVIRLKPKLAAGHLNLGRALQEQRKLAGAVSAYQQAVKLKPDSVAALECLGNALLEMKQFEQAISVFNQALHYKPDSCSSNWSLGKIFIALGRDDDALSCYRRAAHLNPNNPQAHFFLGCGLIKANRSDEAVAEFREAIRLKPDSPDWQFQLAAITGDGSEKTAPIQYLQNLFDGYAPNFEKHLVDRLHYHIPELLFDQVLAATSQRQFDCLDLGCGTGLCGLKFRRMARRLVGVDISQQMLKIAKARNIYDELHAAELVEWLRSTPQRFDLILAADVLIYIGDLTDLMPAIAKVLRIGGLFACSLEEYSGSGFMLHSEERFCHSVSYFCDLATASGLTELSAAKVIVRKNRGIDVPGWNVLVAKAG